MYPSLYGRIHHKFQKNPMFFAPKIADVCIWRTLLPPLSAKCSHSTNPSPLTADVFYGRPLIARWRWCTLASISDNWRNKKLRLTPLVCKPGLIEKPLQKIWPAQAENVMSKFFFIKLYVISWGWNHTMHVRPALH